MVDFGCKDVKKSGIKILEILVVSDVKEFILTFVLEGHTLSRILVELIQTMDIHLTDSLSILVATVP